MRINLKSNSKKKSNIEVPEHKYDLLECHFMPDQWKVLVVCILLNRTTRRQVERIIYGFFREFRDHEELLSKKSLIQFKLYSLGMATRRTETLINFCLDYIEYLEGNKTIDQLHGIGKYAYDCWRLLFLDDLTIKPEDKALKNYIKYYDQDFTICPICAMNKFVSLLDDGICPKCLWHDKHYQYRRGLPQTPS